jgi:hypothetical protein
MKVHNAIIYHCLKCGSIAHNEFEDEPPHCCRREMVKSAVETIREANEASADEQCEAALAGNR